MNQFAKKPILTKTVANTYVKIDFYSVITENTMAIAELDIQNALKTLIDPNTGKDFISSKSAKNIQITGNHVSVDIVLGYPAKSVMESVKTLVAAHLKALEGVENVNVNIGSRIVAHKAQQGVTLLPNVKNIIAVASGKGGVGKSTTSVNLALALAAEGATVGLLDADIYGPSQPQMLGISGRPESSDGKSMDPMLAHGIQAMSIGFLVDVDTPMVWRGPMVTGALEQLLRETRWDNLDYLVIDLPPGTGDIQLTLAQKIPVTGAIIVTTPQDIALLDARKGLKMFEKVGIPILGIVENMSTHICSNCGHEEHIFGAGGGQKMCDDYKVDLLGSLPLDISIRELTDSGKPTVISQPDSKIADIYKEIARKAAIKIANASLDHSSKFPNIVIQNT
jgi:ATP-binding protein involved in chromosome partitioning